MEKNRIHICGKANQALKTLKGQTGLTPNILCRAGLCLSLKQESVPSPEDYILEGDTEVREFNRYTLFGKDDQVYMALLRQWIQNKHNSLGQLTFHELLEAHLNRGAFIMAKSKDKLLFASL